MQNNDGYRVLMDLDIPTFRFSLREDLKDNKEFLPTKAEPLATGWDVRAALVKAESIRILPFQKVLIPLGFRSFCPEGWWFELKPRSSTFGKKALHCLYGTIDESYEGELLLACQYIPESISSVNEEPSFRFANPLFIKFGEALGQIIPVKRQDMLVQEVSSEDFDALCKSRNSARGAGGFGSTSK